MNTNKKEQLENKYTPSGVTEQLVLPSKDSLRMGASGGIGLVAGTGAKIAKGAFQVVKSIFKKKTPVGSGPSRGGNFNEIANQKRGNFIQINFSSVPKHIGNFSSSLKFDSNVLRFFNFCLLSS